MTIFVEHDRSDKCFAVFIGADDDVEGDHDRLYSYGIDDNGHEITVDEARTAALRYAKRLSEFNGNALITVTD